MKNNKFIYAIAILIFSLQLNSQVVNINPDPNSEPWLTGDGVLLSPEEDALIPELELTPESAAMTLPDEVYNDDLVYFPPIFHQEGASCVQAAEIGYTFTYEINRLRDVAAGVWGNENDRENLYYHLYTYNFLNQGSGSSYTTYTSGFSIIKENGCPMYNVYDDPALYSNDKFKYWMTGYEKYASGMENRISGYYYIYFDYSYSSLDLLKHWVADHNEGSETGGLAIIAVLTGGWNTNSTLPEGTPHGTEKVITQLGTTQGTGHALTIVGYDENVVYDFNGDGQYTTDIDINGDGVVNLLDREKGAFKIANSWGPYWKNQGFIWLPYKVMPGQLQMNNKAYVCQAIDNYQPQLAVKINTEYPQRRKLRFKVGYANNANQTTPVSYTWFNSFRYQGGLYQMRGAYSGPIEFGLNYGYWYLNQDVGKIFLLVDESEYTTPYADGTIGYFSIVDYRWGEEFELYCDETNVAIVNDDETVLSIDYDLIPHENPINDNLSLFSNMVSRFNPTVTNNSTLTVEEGVRIDMYNSTININSGSKLLLEDNVVINAKKGLNKIIINGDMEVGNNVTFNAEENSELQIIINNNNLNIIFDNSSFVNCNLSSSTAETKIINTSVNNSSIDLSAGNAIVTNSVFTNNSSVHIYHPIDEGKVAEITNSDFSNINTDYAIYIDYYPIYKIQNNNISYCTSGIYISNSGYGKGYTDILDNNISNNSSTGIIIYSSTANLRDNTVNQNNIGLKLLDKCMTNIEGNKQIITQQFTNNDHYQMYITKGSFPHVIRYNKIFDDDNTVCWVQYTGSEEGLDIRYNNWGGNYVPANNVCPTGAYLIEPIWNPGGSGSGTDAEAMFNNAANLAQQEDYTAAKTEYQQVITQYPDTKFAQAALKELVNLEKYAGNDYSSLKNYYETEPAIQNNPELVKLADFLANRCNIKLANWPDAISWFENVIQNPESVEDSIFAIIDLSYTYWLMENGGMKASSYVGSMPQYKFTDYATFEDNRDYLLSLLPGDDSNLSESMKQKVNALQDGELLQNVPNPFNGTTRIFYKLNNDAIVTVNIFDYTGKQIKTYTEGEKSSGVHSVVFDAKGMTPGMYFYSIDLNGVRSDSKKMIVE